MYPRLLGVLALLWGLRSLLWPTAGWTVSGQAPIAMVVFLAAGVWLVVAREAHLGAGILAMGCIFELLARPAVNNPPLMLLLWASVVVVVTERRPAQRALLLRVCASTVYGFTALSKLNPSWLAGEGLSNVGATRPMLEPFYEVLASPVGLVLAVLVVVVEGWMAVGLWLRRTRGWTAALGVGLHVMMLPVATRSASGLVFLIVLNFGLVALYPAFWHGLGYGTEPTRGATSPREPQAVVASKYT